MTTSSCDPRPRPVRGARRGFYVIWLYSIEPKSTLILGHVKDNSVVDYINSWKNEKKKKGQVHDGTGASTRPKPWASTGSFTVLTFSPTSSFGQRPKTSIPGPFGAKDKYVLKSSQKRTLRVLPMVQTKAHCTFFWLDKAQLHRSLPTLLDFQLFFVVFSQPEALHSSTLCPP